MSEAHCNSDKTTATDCNLQDLTFDPSNTPTPSLRPPNLSEGQLQAAISFGFNDKFLPSSVTGGGPTQPNISERSSNRVSHSASMINNHSNYNSNQTSGTQNQYPLFVDNYSYNLTEEQKQGLLSPLQRPDINQIPPDVLAVLLKSPRFGDIIIPPPRRLEEISSSVNFNDQQQPRSQNAQEINTCEHQNNKYSSLATSQQQQQSKSDSAKFNPFAKEFVPSPSASSFQSTASMNSRQSEDLAYAMSQINVQNQHDSFQSLSEELDGSDCVLSTVTDMISQVSQDPASLNRCAKMTVNVLKKHLHDDDTLGIVVTLLVEQMIANSNFCYSGAKILDILRENNIGTGESSMKTLVLNRMREEFTHCLNNLDDPEVRTRSLGVLRLLSELYMNFKAVATGKPNILAMAILELMQKLVEKDKSLDSVKCVCQLLKLIGWEVENSENEKVRELFELVMKELSYIRMTKDDGALHPTCVILVDNIFKLKSNKWNREQEDATPDPSVKVPMFNPYASKNPVPVYYDEVPESDDDSFGDDGAIMIDDEPDEVQAAYEEFLKMSSKK